MTLLRGLGVEDLTKPELTGNWEYQLAEMEQGRLKREAFMAEIAQMAERIVRKAKEYDRDTIPGDYATLATPCPNCGGVVKENYRRFACTGKPPACGRKAAASRSARSPAAAASSWTRSRHFLRDKKIGPLEGFRSKAGWPFTAELKLAYDDEIKNWKLEFDFGEDAKSDGESASRWTSRRSRAWAPARSARATSTSTAPATSASTRSARTSPATSRAARSSCSSRWRASR